MEKCRPRPISIQKLVCHGHRLMKLYATHNNHADLIILFSYLHINSNQNCYWCSPGETNLNNQDTVILGLCKGKSS